jgi:Ferritin-like
MLLLKRISVNNITELRYALQQAIELEHSTIPPYLTANFTLHDTGNDEIMNLVGSVVGEEMLHLSIACNVLNAVGGSPILNNPKFVPAYPGPLPGGVESGLIVPLEKFSKELVEKVFMVIEMPEDPIDIKRKMLSAEKTTAMTIGEFYMLIIAQMEVLEAAAQLQGGTIFTGNPARQMTNEKWFPLSELYPITNLETAVNGLNLIIDQGEGTATDPFVNGKDENGNPNEPAHYYRFQEIVMGFHLQEDSTAKSGYSYSGAPIPFDPAKIPNMWPNPKMNDYPTDSLAYVNSKFFNYNYSSLLNCLHATFNGEPKKIDTAMGLMFSIRLYAFKLLQTADPVHPGYMAGPSYEYVTNEDLSPAEERELLGQVPKS